MAEKASGSPWSYLRALRANQNHYHTPGEIIVISAAIEDLTGVGDEIHNISAFNASHQPVEKNR